MRLLHTAPPVVVHSFVNVPDPRDRTGERSRCPYPAGSPGPGSGMLPGKAMARGMASGRTSRPPTSSGRLSCARKIQTVMGRATAKNLETLTVSGRLVRRQAHRLVTRVSPARLGMSSRPATISTRSPLVILRVRRTGSL